MTAQLYFVPVLGNPSCLQTTSASLLSHESSQTMPHSPAHISTLPAVTSPASLRLPLLQGPSDDAR